MAGKKDFKNKFYRSLDLDKDSKEILKWWHKKGVQKQLMNDEIDEECLNEED